MEEVLSGVNPVRSKSSKMSVTPAGRTSNGVKNIYLVGIGGAGMSSLAFFLRNKGFSVAGSDIQDSSRIEELRKRGVKIFIGHKKEQLNPDTHLLGYSSAVKRDNPEIKEAFSKGIAVLKRGELLARLCEGEKTVAVAGSHGKTTTTALTGYFLSSLGYNPAVFLGGVSLNEPFRPLNDKNDYFVAETDESDGSFLYCKPRISIITNIDKEHLDHYRGFEGLKKSFFDFARQTKDKVIGWSGQPYLSEIISETEGISFGWGRPNIIRGENFRFDGTYSCFDLYIKEDFIFTAKTLLLGEHNCLNVLASFAFLYYINEDLEKANSALKSFKGTKRRFQFKEKIGGVTFVDDYAHHPTEIKAVLSCARLLKPKRLFVVFQPHRYSRVRSLSEEFSSCFSGADKLIITDIYGACEENAAGAGSQGLCGRVKGNFSDRPEYIPKEDILKKVPSRFKEGDLVLALGAGDINFLMNGVIDEFRGHQAKT